MRKKRIAVLHAQVPFSTGGAEAHVSNLVKNLKLRDYEVECISMPFKWYPGNALLDSYMMWRMVDLTESNGEKIDLVIPLKVPTFAVKHPNKVAWIMHQHRAAYDLKDSVEAGGLNTIPGGVELIKQITKMDTLTINESRAVFANSKNVATRLKKFNGIDAKPLYHPPALAGQYYTSDYENYILSVGRLDKTKRIDILIRALQYCDQNIRVKIAGKGPTMDELQKLATSIGVSNRVDFLGFVSDKEVLELYANALAVCFPPIDEDYGYITLEAFLSRKAIITCKDSGGVLEFAKDGENSFVVDCDAEQIGNCFNRLSNNVSMAKEMGETGYNAVKDISWDYAIDKLTKTIR